MWNYPCNFLIWIVSTYLCNWSLNYILNDTYHFLRRSWWQTLNWQCRLMTDAELTVQAGGRCWTDSVGWWQTLNWQCRLMADAELTVQADGRCWTDSAGWWQTLNLQCRLMADTELTVQTDGRRWTDSAGWLQTLNWQYRLMADTELTVHTVWFSFGSYYTHDYFLISYFHRIPFGFIFPLSVVWCSFVNFLSQFAITCVLCCVQFMYVYCMWVGLWTTFCSV